MASTYVDNFTLTDTINSSSYTSNAAAGTINLDNYAATGASTHTIPAAFTNYVGGAIMDDGVSQKSLYEQFLEIQIKWDTAMMSLDDSSGVATTTYEAGCAIGALAGTYNIHPNGMGTKEIATFVQAVATKFAACTALLDADATLSDTNYASTLDIDFTTITGGNSLNSSATPFDITAAESYIKTTGIKQGALVSFLNTAVTNINALWVKLDADI